MATQRIPYVSVEHGRHFALMSNSHHIHLKGKRSWLTPAQTRQQRSGAGPGTAAFPEFLSTRSGLPEKGQTQVVPLADNEVHLKGPGIDRKKLKVIPRD